MPKTGQGLRSLFRRRTRSEYQNKLILKQALSERGYGNNKTGEADGEHYFIAAQVAPTDPKVCIDIGAHSGEYTQQLLDQTNAFVTAFEPVPTTFEMLQDRLSHVPDRVRLERMGVGNVVGEAEIHLNTEKPRQASFSKQVDKVKYVNNATSVMSQVTTLDAYCAAHGIDHIDLVKMDTEGFEGEVFEGAARVFREVRPHFIQIEFNWHQLFRNHTVYGFSQLLEEYNLYQLVPGGWAKRDPADPLSNIFMFSNFVFVNRTWP